MLLTGLEKVLYQRLNLRFDGNPLAFRYLAPELAAHGYLNTYSVDIPAVGVFTPPI